MAGKLALQPISGLTYERRVIQPEAPPAGIHGGPADPKHGQPGETAEPYPWIEFLGPHGPYGPGDDELLSEGPEQRTLPAGLGNQNPFGDQTPYGPGLHAGPITKGMPAKDRGPEGTAAHLQQSFEAHSVNTGSQLPARASSNPLQDRWEFFWNAVQGEDLLPPVPGQVSAQAAGIGANDRTSNAYHKANQYGLNMSHRLRRYAYGPIPGNTMWMQPGGRVLHKTLAGPSRPPIGEGPFSGQDMTQAYGIQGAILQDPATEYVSPPQPYVVPAAQQGYDESAPPIELW